MKRTTTFSLVMVAVILIGTMGYLSFSEAEGHEHEHDDDHDHSVEIEGSEMKLLTVGEVSDLWEIDEEVFLSRIIVEFSLEESYTVDSVLDDIRGEYAFSPAIIKDTAEEMKREGM